MEASFHQVSQQRPFFWQFLPVSEALPPPLLKTTIQIFHRIPVIQRPQKADTTHRRRSPKRERHSVCNAWLNSKASRRSFNFRFFSWNERERNTSTRHSGPNTALGTFWVRFNPITAKPSQPKQVDSEIRNEETPNSRPGRERHGLLGEFHVVLQESMQGELRLFIHPNLMWILHGSAEGGENSRRTQKSGADVR